jgi:peroxiredoxin
MSEKAKATRVLEWMLSRLLLAFAAPVFLAAAVPLLEDASTIGIAVGSHAPGFSHLDQNGRPRDLQSLTGPKGLVLVFFRSADWCVYCKLQLAQLQRDLPVIRNAGLGLAAISYDSPRVLRDFALRKAVTLPLLSDHDSQTIRAFGVANRQYRKGTMIDVKTETVTYSWGDVPVYGISYPAVFILDPDGKVQWRFVSEADELRLTGAAILERSMPSVALHNRRLLDTRGQIQISTTSSNLAAGLGNRLIIGLEVKMPPAVHVYSPQVGSDYHGISWRMNRSPCWSTGDPLYPEAQWLRMKFSGEKLPVYENTVRITRELAIQPVLSASDPAVFQSFMRSCVDSQSRVTASGVLTYQACDEGQCFPPKSIPVNWNFQFLPMDRQRVAPEIRREFEP